MRAKGNGRPEICAANLLLIRRGEVPYNRIKGLDASLIDRPASLYEGSVRADTLWVLETFEPRIDMDAVASGAYDIIEGAFVITVDVKTAGGSTIV